MDNKDKELLENQLKRLIQRLFKEFLTLTDEVRQDHLVVVKDIATQFPPEFVARWNYLDLPRYSRLRKKILDSGNDAVREISSILDDFQISR